ncbi:MAG: type VI secretion system contractile sheath large subunit [Planctomycetaceae bacterium]
MINKDRTITSSVSFGIDAAPRQAVLQNDTVYRILVIGDLGAATPFHPPIPIDRDDLDDVIQRLQVQTHVQLNTGDPSVSFPIREFEDFHPDRLYNQLAIFETMRMSRQRLQNESTCGDEIEAILRANTTDSGDSNRPGASASQDIPSDMSSPNTESLLSNVLNMTQVSQETIEQQVLSGEFNWDTYVRRLVAPYTVDKADPRQAELVTAIDLMITDTMRSILHNVRFQRLEATWRGIQFLTRRLETGSTLQLCVMHVSREDLEADVCSVDDLTQSVFYKRLVDDVTQDGASPWSLVVADFQFGNSTADCEILTRTAKVCEAAGTLLAAAAAPAIAGCDDLTEDQTPNAVADPREWKAPDAEEIQRWNMFRNESYSNSVVLALPKLMGRRPYGRDSDPIESFVFEEIPDGTQRAQYLWINAAFGVAALLGQDAGQEVPSELERIPVHVYEHDGEELIQSGAELMLSQRAAEKFADMGLTVFRAVRGEDTIRVATIRTLSIGR